MDAYVYSINEIAKKEGVFWETVSDLIRRHNIPTGRHPHNGRARAVSAESYSKLRHLLNSADLEAVASN